MIAISRFELGSFHVRGVINRVPVIILKHPQHVAELRAGNEYNAGPMMDHPARTTHGLSVVAHFQFLHLYLAAFQRRVSFRALLLGQPINPQQPRAALQLCLIPCFGQFHITFERFLRLCLQFWEWWLPCPRGAR